MSSHPPFLRRREDFIRNLVILAIVLLVCTLLALAIAVEIRYLALEIPHALH